MHERDSVTFSQKHGQEPSQQRGTTGARLRGDHGVEEEEQEKKRLEMPFYDFHMLISAVTSACIHAAPNSPAYNIFYYEENEGMWTHFFL